VKGYTWLTKGRDLDGDKSIEPNEAAPVVYPQNYEIVQGEQILWEHDVVTGVFHRETVEEWIITNMRAMKRYPVSKKNLAPRVAFVGHSISESIVMNQHRQSQGNRVGNFVGSYSAGSFGGVSSGVSKSTSTNYGDLVFLANDKEMFRFCSISDPNGVNRLVKALRKELLQNKKKVKEQSP
jgi:hypothetical protein